LAFEGHVTILNHFYCLKTKIQLTQLCGDYPKTI